MLAKERLLSNINSILRKDEYINELLKASGIEMDEIDILLEDIYKQFWFDTMTWGLDILAKEAGIHFTADQSLEEKRSQVQAKWRSKGKLDIQLLQTICDSWKNGETEVDFTDRIIVKFVGSAGIPSDIDTLKESINKVKRAGKLVEYIFKYILISEMEAMTIAELETITLDKFAGGEI